MQDLVKQMETMQREYLLERQALRAQLLAAVQSQEVVADLPLAALYSLPGTVFEIHSEVKSLHTMGNYHTHAGRTMEIIPPERDTLFCQRAV